MPNTSWTRRTTTKIASNVPPVGVQQFAGLFFPVDLHSPFRIQSEAWRVNFSVAAALSASTYSRTIGSVPLKRTRIHEPSSNSNFAPSVRSTDTTFLPSSVEASTATLRMVFAFCSSEGELVSWTRVWSTRRRSSGYSCKAILIFN